MAKVGGGNPMPFEVGGGPSSSELAYEAMRAAVGLGGAAEDGTIEAAWRMARARGLRAAFCDGRAAANYLPDRATDALPVYEEILDVVAAPGTSDQERRDAVTDRWTQVPDATTAALQAELQEIDALFSIIDGDRDSAATTVLGRAFEDWTPSDPDASGPAFGGGRKSTLWPNYSSDFHCLVLYALSAGAITVSARNNIERAKALLNEALPAWVDFLFSRTTTGFTLDTDLLDLGSFGS